MSQKLEAPSKEGQSQPLPTKVPSKEGLSQLYQVPSKEGRRP